MAHAVHKADSYTPKVKTLILQGKTFTNKVMHVISPYFGGISLFLTKSPIWNFGISLYILYGPQREKMYLRVIFGVS